MRGDQSSRQVLHVLTKGRNGERLDVPDPVQQLVLERKVTEQRLVEGLCLLGQCLDGRGRAAEQRRQHVRETAEVADGRFEGHRALPPESGVLGEFASNGFGARLSDARLGDLNLRVGELKDRPQLDDQGTDVVAGQRFPSLPIGLRRRRSAMTCMPTRRPSVVTGCAVCAESREGR